MNEFIRDRIPWNVGEATTPLARTAAMIVAVVKKRMVVEDLKKMFSSCK